MAEDGQIMSKTTVADKRSANRLEHNPWRDRRVITGIAVVLVSAVVGGGLWIATTATDTYWAVAHDVKAGQEISPNQLRQVEVTVPSSVSRTLHGQASRPRGVWAQDLSAGSLVSRDGVRDGRADGQRLPLRVSNGSLPSGLAPGDIVNVWVGPSADDLEVKARRVLTDVKVVHVSQDLGGADRTVLVDVGIDGPTSEVVAVVAEQHVTVVQVR